MFLTEQDTSSSLPDGCYIPLLLRLGHIPDYIVVNLKYIEQLEHQYRNKKMNEKLSKKEP